MSTDANGSRGRGLASWGPWFAVFAGPAAWAVHLGTSYALLPRICATRAEFMIHLLTGATALVAAAAVLVGWQSWRRVRDAGRPGVEDPASRPSPFLAVSGVLLSGFFLLLILLEGLPPLLMEDACLRPTRHQLIVLMSLGEATLHSAVPLVSAASPLPPLVPLTPLAELLATIPGADTAAAIPAAATPAATPIAADPIAPDALWHAWKLHPWWLLFAFGGAVWGYGRGVRRMWSRAGSGRGVRRWRVACFAAGLLLLGVALFSPLAPLGHALFAFHMVQHLVLTVLAAPLLVLGAPWRAFAWALPYRTRKRLPVVWRGAAGWRANASPLLHPAAALALHTATLWTWHLPGPYQAALAIPWLHDLEHATLLVTGLHFWWAVTRRPGLAGAAYGAGVLYVFLALLQGSALGALITFASQPWYPAHATGAALWNIDLLRDQQLAGLLMWVPAGLVYVLAAILLLVAGLRMAERHAAAAGPRPALSVVQNAGPASGRGAPAQPIQPPSLGADP